MSAQSATAQSVDVSELERCSALETAVARLACFEALVAEDAEPVRVEPEPAVQAPIPDTEPPVLVETSEATSTTEPAAPPAAEVAAAPAPVPEPATPAAPAADPPLATAPAVETRTAAVPAQAPAAATAAVVESAQADSLANWGLDDDDDEPESAQATVVNVTKTRLGELVFHFDNGQIWRQQEKRYFSYPRDGEFDVIVSKGMLGSFRLQVVGAGRRVGIKRLR